MDHQKVIKPREGLHLEENSSLPPGAPHSSFTLTVPPYIRLGLESVREKFPGVSLSACAVIILHAGLSALKSEGMIRDFDSDPS